MTLQIELNGVNKFYGSYHALKDIDLAIEEGTFVALVGPSGCGKSTLLRSLAGLEKISAGEMKIAGARMNDVPPRKRDVAMVFQSYALYPHMTVEENLTYSLRDGTTDNVLIVLESGGRIAATRGSRSGDKTELINAVYSPCPVVTPTGCPKNPSWKITAAKVSRSMRRPSTRQAARPSPRS